MKMMHSLWKEILILNIIKVCSTSNEFQQESKQCIGKHQIPIEDLFDFELAKELKEPINMKNFNVLPVETILENNDQTIVVNMTYNTHEVPTINFGASAGLSTYRFEFLYFQWYESSATTLPFELHAVFYNTKFTEFQKALNRKNMVVVLAFSLELKSTSTSTSKYAFLNKNIKSVQTGLTKTAIENRPLNIWLPSLTKAYLMYEGDFPFHNCTAQVLWVDFEWKISLEPKLVKEFQMLQTSLGRSLMKQYKAFLRPSGSLVINTGMYSNGEDDALGSIPLVDAYNDDYDGGYVPFGGSAEKSQDIKKLSVLIIFFEFYFIFL